MPFIFAICLVFITFSRPAFAQYITGSDSMSGTAVETIMAYRSMLGRPFLDLRRTPYIGVGSHKGELDLATGRTGVAILNRPFSDEMLELASKNGITPFGRPFALFRSVIVVNGENGWLDRIRSQSRWSEGITAEELKSILSCKLRNWDEIPRLNKSGRINVYISGEAALSADTVKKSLFLEKFGDCVNRTPGYTQELVLQDRNAIGIMDYSKARFFCTSGSLVALPVSGRTFETRFYVYKTGGTKTPDQLENDLFEALSRQSSEFIPILDSILMGNGFIPVDN